MSRNAISVFYFSFSITFLCLSIPSALSVFKFWDLSFVRALESLWCYTNAFAPARLQDFAPEEVLSSRRTASRQRTRLPGSAKNLRGSLIRSKERERARAIKRRSDKGSERTRTRGRRKRRRWRRRERSEGCSKDESSRGGSKEIEMRSRVISLPRSLHLLLLRLFHPRVFPLNSAISLERNFPDIRSTGFRFRFLFCASSASSASLLVKSWRSERMTSGTKTETILRALSSMMQFFSSL